MIKLINKIIKKIQKQHVDVYILNLYIHLRLVDDKLRIYMYIVYLQREFTNHIRKKVYVIIPFRKAIFHKCFFI